jgi:hypothetical protein
VIEISRKGQLVNRLNPKYVVLLIDLTWSTRLGPQLQKGPETNEGRPLKILDARLLNYALLPDVPHVIILLCLTPDDFTRQGEHWCLMG